MSKPQKATGIGRLFLRTKEEPSEPRFDRAQWHLMQFWMPKILWRQLQELAREESLKRGKTVSLAQIMRRALRAELQRALTGVD